jgi:DNA-directed RNA polymerase subunit RPC12/RpoP
VLARDLDPDLGGGHTLGVAIDRSGKWWTGEDLNDLAEYLRELGVEGYAIDEVRESRCSLCGEGVFGLRADRTEGGAQRTCRGCGHKQLIADSDDYWEDCTPRTWKCVCGGKDANLAVGYSPYADGAEVRWIAVAQRCVNCGVMGS